MSFLEKFGKEGIRQRRYSFPSSSSSQEPLLGACGCCVYYLYYYYYYYYYCYYYLVLLYVYYYGVSFSRTSFLCLIHAFRENSSSSSSSSNTQKMNVLASAMEKLLATNALRGLYGR